jgi:flavodoxin
MPKALVVYASRTGQTQNIADLIAEGIRFAGAEAVVKNATDIKKEEDLQSYDAWVFGSATYHGEMMSVLKTMLFLAEKVDMEGKPGGSFGAFGWSGEAPGRIYDTMKNIYKMDMVSSSLNLKSASLGGGTQMAQSDGKDVGKKMMGE